MFGTYVYTMNLSQARSSLAYKILVYESITMRQHDMYILYLYMTLNFDLYVYSRGIFSEFYSHFLSCFFLGHLKKSCDPLLRVGVLGRSSCVIFSRTFRI